MPPSLRRRGQPPPQIPQEPPSESDEEFDEEDAADGEEILEPEMTALDEDEEEDDDEEHLASPHPSPQPPSSLPPPGFREISTLASWTVSSSKPGCSIPQLRHPSTSLFWQSDGPQPHYLNIHFFKLVRIVGLRLYLDFEADESYTPTRIVLLAGSGMNDLVEWGEMRLESPRGWVWADFEGVGECETDSEEEDDDDDDEGTRAMEHAGRTAAAQGDDDAGLGIHSDASDFENSAPHPPIFPPPPFDPMALDPPRPSSATQPLLQGTPALARPHPRHPFATLSPNTTPRPAGPGTKRPKMPVLRCHLVQIKILENHQNGKDTHLRGLQIFARDGEEGGPRRKKGGAMGGLVEGAMSRGSRGARGGGGGEMKERRGLAKSEWMVEPSIR